jgi:hypothetical protein
MTVEWKRFLSPGLCVLLRPVSSPRSVCLKIEVRFPGIFSRISIELMVGETPTKGESSIEFMVGERPTKGEKTVYELNHYKRQKDFRFNRGSLSSISPASVSALTCFKIQVWLVRYFPNYHPGCNFISGLVQTKRS